MLYYDRIYVSKSIYINKTSTFKEGIIYHCWCFVFLDKRFKFQSSVSDGCYDVYMMSIDINSSVILNIHGADYCCIIVGITKPEAINLLKNADLSGSLWSIQRFFYHVYKINK